MSSTILIIGDSISAAYGINRQQGWANLLQTRLQTLNPDYKVINASISGDTTLNGLHRISPLLKRHRPDIVIIELGGNDGLRGLSLDEMEKNLGQMIRLSQQAGSQVVLIGIRMPPNYGAHFTRQFATIFQQLAQQYAIPLVPQILANIAEHPELMQPDGIHPQADAQSLIVDNIWPTLKTLLRSEKQMNTNRGTPIPAGG